MTFVTGTPLSQINIVALVNEPGAMTVVLDEHLRCERCGRTGPNWTIPLTYPTDQPTGPATARTSDTPRKRFDPGH